MRNVIQVFLLFFTLAPLAIQGQSADDSFKTAKKSLSQYYLDPANKGDKLQEAKNAIENAVQLIDQIDEKKQGDVYLEMGKIFNAVSAISKNAEDALKAYQGGKMGFDLSDKSFKKKEAMSSLAETAGYLSNAGSLAYSEGNYQNAYTCFSSILEINDLLQANGHPQLPLESEEKYNDLAFYAGLSAKTAGMNAESKTIFEKLMDKGYEKAYMYEAMFDLSMAEDKDRALNFLKVGRQKFPDDQGLLYAEINYYIQEGKLDDLLDKLKQAIAKDPDNISLYTALGSAYDNLSQREESAGNMEQSAQYFNDALTYYNQALEKDPQNVDAYYSVGVLYYNKAAALTEELVALQDDLSKEGQKKYEAKQNEMQSLFDKATPFFKEAEMLNPNDRNTLIALKEIYAKRGNVEDLEISNEFKKRLELIDGGGQNEASYFKKN